MMHIKSMDAAQRDALVNDISTALKEYGLEDSEIKFYREAAC